MRLMKAIALGAALLGTAVASPAAAPTATDCQGDFAQVLVPAPGVADARAVWLDGRHIRWPGAGSAAAFKLLHAAQGGIVAAVGQPARGADGALSLSLHTAGLPAATTERFKWVAAGPVLRVADADLARLPELHRGELVLVQEDAEGRVVQATAVQVAGALDGMYAAAETSAPLGATIGRGVTHFRLWAPTARNVSLCLFDSATAPTASVLPLARDARTGIWSADAGRDLSGHAYTYLVDVFVRGTGLVRNRVTDPYALSLNADSQRTWIGSLDRAEVKPRFWDRTRRPEPTGTLGRAKRSKLANTDLVVYELHVRDFSIGDKTVPAAQRGKYLAFTHTAGDGMKHLRALAAAGVTDVHLLPVFDIASVPERGCTTPDSAVLSAAAPDSPAQQAAVMREAAGDCFNWGYDPWHFTAPEGSYASDPMEPTARIVEFRAMVQALHRAGLRVGMDMVYNHTTASGQKAQSVLDRIVPGYYQRLDANGVVERSTCCDNTATENRMMARLMIDSAVVWARDHHIDSFRFDLMGHQPRAAMERLQAAVNKAAGRPIHLIGEGWNFGEVANGARFVQAAQGALNGSGIGSFSDRGRDAVRGGGCCDSGAAVVQRQGWSNGLAYDRNTAATAAGVGTDDELRASTDLVRIGLAGTLRDFEFTTRSGQRQRADQVDYAGQPAGFAAAPGEVVNYVENHDNPTLFDLNVLKLPAGTGREDRARAQVVALATTAFSQGVAYFHAGVELLRSKSGDRNSYDSGDWFNRIDWTLQDNFFGTGLPPESDNAAMWVFMKPLLVDAARIKPTPADIRFTRDAFIDLLKIRASTPLFRLQTAADVQQRLSFPAGSTGPLADAALVVARLDGRGRRDAVFAELLLALNPKPLAVTVVMPELIGRAFELHPVHRAAGAADRRAANESRWDAATATLVVPARTAVVFVRR